MKTNVISSTEYPVIQSGDKLWASVVYIENRCITFKIIKTDEYISLDYSNPILWDDEQIKQMDAICEDEIIPVRVIVKKGEISKAIPEDIYNSIDFRGAGEAIKILSEKVSSLEHLLQQNRNRIRNAKARRSVHGYGTRWYNHFTDIVKKTKTQIESLIKDLKDAKNNLKKFRWRRHLAKQRIFPYPIAA